MRIGFIVNTIRRLAGETSTTYALASRLARSGHEVWVASAGAFELGPAGRVKVSARSTGDRKFRSSRRFVDALLDDRSRQRQVSVRELDTLFLRFNPFALKDWALLGALDFARRAADEGVLVVNDADGLSRATSKLYLEDFPEEVRPRTLITRSRARIERFLAEERRIVLKPLRGYGGRNVFLATNDNRANLDRILGVLSRDGFAVAQEYLPAAEEGDTRLFLLDGEPIVQDGKYAVVRRARSTDDIRSNVHAGGEPRRAQMTDALHRIAECVAPKLRADGMFFVGLDVAGDKLLEINVFSPGGLHALRELEGVDFTRSVAHAIEGRMADRRARDRDGAP